MAPVYEGEDGEEMNVLSTRVQPGASFAKTPHLCLHIPLVPER